MGHLAVLAQEQAASAFTQAWYNTVISLILNAGAAFWCWRGAMVGMARHRVPRVVLAIGLTFMAIAYFLNLMAWIDTATRREILIPSFWVVCIGVMWTSITGMQAGKTLRIEAAGFDLLQEQVDKYNTIIRESTTESETQATEREDGEASDQ